MLSATILRMTHMSSTQVLRCGSSSLTSVPHSPCFWNDHGEPRRLPVLVRSSFGFSKGRGLPLSFAKRGFGSKRSTCDGPPDMNRKMIRFAFAGYCGGLTARGDATLWASAFVKKSFANKPERPSMPKPLAKRRRAWRRVIGDECMAVFLVYIDKLIRAKEHLAVLLPLDVGGLGFIERI